MFEPHRPPLRLNEPPPVKYNCTKEEFELLKRIFIFLSILSFVVLFSIFLVLGIFNNIAPTIIFALAVSGLGGWWIGLKSIKRLGKMKDTKSAKYVYQLIEKQKANIGFGNRLIISRVGKWSLSR